MRLRRRRLEEEVMVMVMADEMARTEAASPFGMPREANQAREELKKQELPFEDVVPGLLAASKQENDAGEGEGSRGQHSGTEARSQPNTGAAGHQRLAQKEKGEGKKNEEECS